MFECCKNTHFFDFNDTKRRLIRLKPCLVHPKSNKVDIMLPT
jgi:hypothetical protein